MCRMKSVMKPKEDAWRDQSLEQKEIGARGQVTIKISKQLAKV